jgi:hypothetical protein
MSEAGRLDRLAMHGKTCRRLSICAAWKGQHEAQDQQ